MTTVKKLLKEVPSHQLDEYSLNQKILGKGGFGTVYKATSADHKVFAVKVFFQDGLEEDDDITDSVREDRQSKIDEAKGETSALS